jgi:L-ascorbate metabolism protein UlaG (beta-lactamase superfamily)
VRPRHDAIERVSWLGHSTVLVETAGARLLTDPLLRSRVAHLRRHVAPAAVPAQVDAVLISHLHHDHLDLPSLRALARDVPLVVPAGAARTRAVRSLRRDVRELAEGDRLEIGGVGVRAVPAVHDDRRLPLGNRAAALGFVIEGGSTVYFAGDTDLFDGMAGIAPDLDLALLPVAGWGPRIGPGHMDPDEAAQAAALLAPAMAVPIHWGTYLPIGRRGRLGHLLRDPGHEFAARVAERAPGVRVVVLAPGEDVQLNPGPQGGTDGAHRGQAEGAHRA